MNDTTWNLIDRSNPELRRKATTLGPMDRESFVLQLIRRFRPLTIEDPFLRDILGLMINQNSLGIDHPKSQDLLETSERLDEEYFTGATRRPLWGLSDLTTLYVDRLWRKGPS